MDAIERKYSVQDLRGDHESLDRFVPRA